ncbi:MmgE/PrpD family protein [Streptomyces chartreusis]|uniref:MmgE/PrpD family protein n=1 Tax=Streptomyces chartreusis TaxID=1969 RepID=UPI00365A9B53
MSGARQGAGIKEEEAPMYISEEIAEIVTAVEDLPPSVSDATRRCILDAVSAAVTGQGTPGGKAARDGAVAAWGSGSIPIWLSSARSTEMGAAFANSAAVTMLDIDDGHRAAAGHPGASIVPAVLAAVHEDPALAPRAVTAVAIGYEVGLRIAASRDVRTLDTVITGRWCGQGVAAAIGWLKRLSPRVIAEAVAAAGSVAPIMAVAEFTEVGNHVKEAIPHATANGLASLHLAQAGLIAPLDILDDARIFSRSTLLDGLGERWMIESCYFKPYSCCRWIHAPIDGLLKIMADENLTFQDITKIHIDTFGKAMTLNNQKAPKSLEAGQFSIPFCLGVLATRGPEALVPMTDPDLLNDPKILAFASLVEVAFDSEMDSYFPSAVPSRISVSSRGATYSETVMAPLGEPSNPMGWDALFGKFHALASHHLASHQEAALRRALDDMRLGDLAPLLSELARPAMEPERVLVR